MASASGLQFTLALAGSTNTDLAVIEFTMEEALSAPFHLSIEAASRHADLSPGDWLVR